MLIFDEYLLNLLTKSLISFDYCNFRTIRSDASLIAPIRQTASIFKQPVTVIKSQESKVKSELKHGTQDKPRQLVSIFYRNL